MVGSKPLSSVRTKVKDAESCNKSGNVFHSSLLITLRLIIYCFTVKEKYLSQLSGAVGDVAEAVVDVTCHAKGGKNEELPDGCMDADYHSDCLSLTINFLGKEYHASLENLDSSGNFVMKLEPGEINYFEIDKWFLCCHCKQQYVNLKKNMQTNQSNM